MNQLLVPAELGTNSPLRNVGNFWGLVNGKQFLDMFVDVFIQLVANSCLRVLFLQTVQTNKYKTPFYEKVPNKFIIRKFYLPLPPRKENRLPHTTKKGYPLSIFHFCCSRTERKAIGAACYSTITQRGIEWFTISRSRGIG